MSAHRGGGRGKFMIIKKCLAYGEDLNTLVASTTDKALKLKKSKAKAKKDSDSDNKLEQFNFENPEIGAKYW